MEVHRHQQYMEALQEELNKIKVFQKELPLSLHLVTQAIDACRRQIAIETMGFQSESEETSSEGARLLEEFIPIRRNSDDTLEQDHLKEENNSDGSHDRGNKPDWLRSAQLWNQDVETSPMEAVDSSRKSSSSETKRDASSSPCCREKRASPATPAVSDPADSAATEGHDKEGNLQKKARRCWSPELHRRFLHALQQLGGSHAATPKYIKEIMKVDGLTNDEIKSHLQKYRLHTSQSSLSTPMSNSQPSQFVLVGGIWAAPQYTAAASCGRAPEVSAATIYTPVATTIASPSITSTTCSPARTRKAKANSQHNSRLGSLPSDGNGSKKLQRSIGHQSSSATSSSHNTSSLAFEDRDRRSSHLD